MPWLDEEKGVNVWVKVVLNKWPLPPGVCPLAVNKVIIIKSHNISIHYSRISKFSTYGTVTNIKIDNTICNICATVPLAHAVRRKEMYENFQILLRKVHCEERRLNVCAELKVIAMLTELQGGYTKFCCFNVNGNCQYRIKIWPPNSGQKIVAHPALWDK